MKRVLLIAVLSSLVSAGGCCCPGPFLHCVGNHIFGPWTCGAGHGAGCGCGSCGAGYAPQGDGCGCGNACGCGQAAGYSGGGCGGGGGCGNAGGCGGCSWYNTGCNSCCSGWGCGDIYLTDLFHPICDPCGWGSRHSHGGACGCGGCGGGYAGGYGSPAYGGCDSCGSPGYMDSGYGGSGCGCGGGSYAAAGSRGDWTAATGQSPRMMPEAQGPMTAQRSCNAGGYSMTAQAMRGPWDNAPPPRGQWAMNRDYVVSQPKVVDDRVVESRPKTATKKTVQVPTDGTAAR